MRHHLFEWKEGLLISLNAIRANKARSILTMLGIVIGICSVALMATAINGIDKAFVNGISALGADNLYIDKYAWFSDEDFFLMRNRKNMTMDQFERFQKLAKLPLAVAPTILTMHKVLYGDNYVEGTLMTGTTDGYVRTTNFNFARGRFFSSLESSGARNVAVLGSEVADHLFEKQDPLGPGDQDRRHPLPRRRRAGKAGQQHAGQFQPRQPGLHPHRHGIQVFPARPRHRAPSSCARAAPSMTEATKEEAIGMMRRVRGLLYDEKDDFSDQHAGGADPELQQGRGRDQAGRLVHHRPVAAGGRHRHHEHHVRFGQGAHQGDRHPQGHRRQKADDHGPVPHRGRGDLPDRRAGRPAAGRAALSMLINKFLPTSVQMNTVVLAISISLLTGIVSGLAPAWTAAKMDPVEALRYE